MNTIHALPETEQERKTREVCEVLDGSSENDYHCIEWPITSRVWTFGTWVNCVLSEWRQMATAEQIKQYVIETHKNDTKEQLTSIKEATERQLPGCAEEHKLVLETWISTITEMLVN